MGWKRKTCWLALAAVLLGLCAWTRLGRDEAAAALLREDRPLMRIDRLGAPSARARAAYEATEGVAASVQQQRHGHWVDVATAIAIGPAILGVDRPVFDGKEYTEALKRYFHPSIKATLLDEKDKEVEGLLREVIYAAPASSIDIEVPTMLRVRGKRYEVVLLDTDPAHGIAYVAVYLDADAASATNPPDMRMVRSFGPDTLRAMIARRNPSVGPAGAGWALVEVTPTGERELSHRLQVRGLRRVDDGSLIVLPPIGKQPVVSIGMAIRGEDGTRLVEEVDLWPWAVSAGTMLMDAPKGSGFLGISGKSVAHHGRAAVRVTDVEPDGPADRAGIRTGDLLVSVGEGRQLVWSGLVSLARNREPGDKLVLHRERAGEVDTLTVRLGRHP